MDKFLYVVIFLGAVLISSIAQIVLKASSGKKYENIIREYLNPMVMGAYIVFFGATLISTFAYREIPLSLGPILESSGYVYVTILSFMFLQEKISTKKLVGNVLIILGIIISFL